MSERTGMLAVGSADVAEMRCEALPALLAELAALQTAVAARLATEPERKGSLDGDGTLSVEQAAGMVGLSVEAFYRRKRFRPALLEVGHRTRRVSERKLRRILAAMEP